MIDIILLLIIFISLFIDYSKFIPDNNILKILFLLIIVSVSFIDIKIAILLTLLFFIIIIKLNKKIVNNLKESFNIKTNNYVKENIPFSYTPEKPLPVENLNIPINNTKEVNDVPLAFTKDTTYLGNISNAWYNYDSNEQCFGEKHKEDISTEQGSYMLDDKVKPYEMYIKNIIHPDSLDKIQSNLIQG